jgi:hypothetical protein
MIIAKPMTPTLVFPAVVRLDFKSVYSPKKIRQPYRGCLFRSKLADTFNLSPFLIGIGLVHLEMLPIVSPNLTGSSRFLWPLMPMPMPPPPLAVYSALELQIDYVELAKTLASLHGSGCKSFGARLAGWLGSLSIEESIRDCESERGY